MHTSTKVQLKSNKTYFNLLDLDLYLDLHQLVLTHSLLIIYSLSGATLKVNVVDSETRHPSKFSGNNMRENITSSLEVIMMQKWIIQLMTKEQQLTALWILTYIMYLDHKKDDTVYILLSSGSNNMCG